MIQNPVLRRETLGLLRTPWSLMLPVGSGMICTLLVLLRWPSEAQADLSGSQAQQVFRLFGYGFLTIILVLLPAYPATSFVREKLRGTLALLLQSQLSPWSIYFGKLLGSLTFVALPLVASLPAAAACYVLGGVSVFGQLLPLYAILSLLALEVVVLGLLISIFSGSTESSLRMTYGLLLVLTVVTLGPWHFVRGNPEGWKGTAAHWIRCLSPIPSVMEVVGQGDVGSAGLLTNRRQAVHYAEITAGLLALAMGLTISRLRPTLFDRSRPAGVVTDDQQFRHRLWRRVLFLVDPQRRSGLIGPLVNPVMVKEFRCRRFGRSHWLFRLLGLCAIASLGLTYAGTAGSMGWGVETIAGIMVLLQFSLICLLVPSLGSILISGERESGGWLLLQATPLSPWQIIIGKLLSAGWTMVLILFATLPGYLVILYIQPEMKQQISYVLFTLLLMAVSTLLMSAAVSSLFSRTVPATVTSYAVLLIVWGGSLLFWLARDSTFGHAVVESVLTINPLAAALSVSGSPGFSQYQLVPWNWWLMIGLTGLSAGVIGYQTRKLTRPR